MIKCISCVSYFSEYKWYSCKYYNTWEYRRYNILFPIIFSIIIIKVYRLDEIII